MTSRAQKLTAALLADRDRAGTPARKKRLGRPVSTLLVNHATEPLSVYSGTRVRGTITEARCKFIARNSAGAVAGEFPTITLAARSLPEIEVEQLKDGAKPGAPNKKSGKSRRKKT
jgi:hypothetical protein